MTLHSEADYYVGAMDLWVEQNQQGNIITLCAPDAGVRVSMPVAKLEYQKLSAIVSTVKRRDGGGQGLLCAEALLPLFRQMQRDPALLAKIIAVTEAHVALSGGE